MPLSEEAAADIATFAVERIEACALDLRGSLVITEAATNAYAVTAPVAAYAGAEVWAYAKSTRYGEASEAIKDTLLVDAAMGGHGRRMHCTTSRDDLPFASADIVTNSGVLRPISAADISNMPSSGAIALMYEAWEAREADIDMEAARHHGIEVVGVNENHPLCGAFDFVGAIAVSALDRIGWLEGRPTVGVVSDNAFLDPVVAAISREAEVFVLDPESEPVQSVDILVLATTPSGTRGSFHPETTSRLIRESGAGSVLQLWGDLDRDEMGNAGISVEPREAVEQGHQGVGMEEAGFEPVARLQVAGLAAVLHRDSGPESAQFGLGQRHVEQLRHDVSS